MTGLEFAGHELVHLAAGSFYWIDIKRFRITEDGDDAELLSALVSHRQYSDHYAGQDPTEQAQHDLHGPYWLSAIRPDVFESTDSPSARQTVLGWANDPEPLTTEVANFVATKVLPLLDAPVCTGYPTFVPSPSTNGAGSSVKAASSSSWPSIGRLAS